MRLRELAYRMLRTGLIGFGGGNALIPVIEREMKDVIDKDTLEEDVMMASITPGALPVEIACGIGSRIRGALGMFTGAFAMAMPGTVFAIVLLAGMNEVSGQVISYIDYASVGISAFICCLLLEYVRKTVKGCIDRCKANKSVILVASQCLIIVLIPFLKISTAMIFVIAFAIILGYHLIESLCRKPTDKPDRQNSGVSFKTLSGKNELISSGALLLAAFLLSLILFGLQGAAFAGKGIFSSLMSFGGGDAYLTVAAGLFSGDGNGLVPEEIFYGRVVPVVNVLPGSILCKTLSSIGYYTGLEITGNMAGGFTFAFIGFILSVGASCFVFMLAKTILSIYNSTAVFDSLRFWIRPIVSGLLIKVGLALARQSIKVILNHTAFSHSSAVIIVVSLFVLGLVLRYGFKVDGWKLAAILFGLTMVGGINC